MTSGTGQTAWERWELASLDTPGRAGAAPHTVDVKLPTAGEIEQLHHQAHSEGFELGRSEGYQAGFQAGQEAARAEAQRLAAAATRLEAGLAALEENVADELLALAVELARQVVREEIAARPETLIAVVREALGQLPHQHAAIYLHPDDASLLRSHLGEQLAHAGHRIHEDLKLARGDCVLESGGTQIDASVAMRWRRVLENLGLQDDAVQAPPSTPASRGDES